MSVGHVGSVDCERDLPMRIIEFLRYLRTIVKVPSLDDEAELRHFLARVLDALAPLAVYTPTKADDLGIAALRTIVMTDEVWAAFYRLLKFAMGDQDLPMLVSATGLSESQLLLLRDVLYDSTHVASVSGFGGPGA